ncbi:MAG TPA: CDP-alcohol phosphatidyltransferase family protein [Terriglobia bacterium]|nr:CDP-alcohol phosphatidyltransferase family protein [Terriglobia bacterium]
MSTRTLTPADQITILRLVFIPLFAILEVERKFGWALAVLAIAMISDSLDGILARLLHQESPVGVALDPIADKLLMATAFLLLAFKGALPWWITIVVLSRDVGLVITALLITLVAGYRPFRPSLLGKVSTFFQMLTIFVAVYAQARISSVTHFAVHLSVYFTLGFTLASAFHYLVTVQKRIAVHPAEEVAAPTSEKAKTE